MTLNDVEPTNGVFQNCSDFCQLSRHSSIGLCCRRCLPLLQYAIVSLKFRWLIMIKKLE